MNTNSSVSPKVIQDPMTDEQVIMELRRRSRHRGHQIVGYRRKLMQQVKFTLTSLYQKYRIIKAYILPKQNNHKVY